MQEHPAGEPPRNEFEAPQGPGGRGPWYRETPPDHTRRGAVAALAIFAAACVLHLLLLAFVKLSGDPDNAWLFLPEGLVVIVGALTVAIIVTLRLPMESRTAFWAVGAACMFMSFIVWGATCAVAL
jgi:hypothetical protein